MLNNAHRSFGDETSLVAAVIRKDEQAFRIFIHQYEKLVMHIVFKMVFNVHDREDLCQEIFLKAYEKLGSFRFQSKLSTWIGNIAFNACVNFLKKKKELFIDDFQKWEEDDHSNAGVQVMDNNQAPDATLLSKEKIVMLNKSIDRLNVIQRTVLQLFHSDECSLEEIAVITELPVNTVKSHLFRARKFLKNELIHLMNQ